MANDRGFTLIEVMIALTLFMIVVVGLKSATAGFVHTVATADTQAAAIHLADDRVSEIAMNRNYAKLDSLYGGTETNFATLDGVTRVTTILRIGGPGDPVDHKVITIAVNGPTLKRPVTRTLTVAAP